MNRINGVALSLLLVGLCLGLTLAFPAFLLTGVMQPIAVSLWLAWRLVTSVDQSTYWALVVLICCIWLVRVLPPGRTKQDARPLKDVQQPITHISQWQALFHNAAQSDAGEAALREHLQELLKEVVGDSEHASASDLERRLLSNRLSPPSTVSEYLFPPAPAGSWLSLDRLRSLPVRCARWARRSLGMPTGPDTATIGELLSWMESMMEMRDDQ